MSLALVNGPTTEPITLAEAKQHLRLGEDVLDDDELIAGLIRAAREYCEKETNRAFFTQTWRLSLDRFPLDDVIELPRPPIASVEQVAYIDESGVQTPYTDYTLDTDHAPPRLIRNYGLCWPSTRCQRNAVMIMFIAGADDVADVPESIKQAMKLLIGHWYENREAVVTGTISTALQMTVDALLDVKRVGVLV